MNILYIGGGFVGACSAAVSADSGHTVLVYDIDQKKVDALNATEPTVIESCLFERGLGDLLVRHRQRVEFTTDYSRVEAFVDTVDAVFMCLPTPEVGETGESNLTYYNKAAEQLGGALAQRNSGKQTQYVVIVNKSTVPVNMVDRTQEMLESAGVQEFGVVSNPEFLVEGKAIDGSIHPDRVVVGASKEKDFAVMRNIYQRFYDSASVKYIEVTPKEAAAGKLLANFYLFNKLALCFDVMGRTAESFDGVQFEHIRDIVMSDKRIGNWGFYDSLYAGGSCLIKDARSLSHQLQLQGENPVIVNEVYLANKRQLERFLGRAESEASFHWTGKRVALLGTAFKQETNDIRNSPSIDIMHFLSDQQVGEVRVYDPAGLPAFKELFPTSDQIVYTESAGDAMQNVDVLIIATDWQEFKSLAESVMSVDKKPLLMDGRRMLQQRYAELADAGCSVIAVGSPFIQGKK